LVPLQYATGCDKPHALLRCTTDDTGITLVINPGSLNELTIAAAAALMLLVAGTGEEAAESLMLLLA
jgi:hypothetical protein